MISADLAGAYQQPAGEVVGALDSNAEHGLTTEEARRRLAWWAPTNSFAAFVAYFIGALLKDIGG